MRNNEQLLKALEMESGEEWVYQPETRLFVCCAFGLKIRLGGSNIWRWRVDTECGERWLSVDKTPRHHQFPKAWQSVPLIEDELNPNLALSRHIVTSLRQGGLLPPTQKELKDILEKACQDASSLWHLSEAFPSIGWASTRNQWLPADFSEEAAAWELTACIGKRTAPRAPSSVDEIVEILVLTLCPWHIHDFPSYLRLKSSLRPLFRLRGDVISIDLKHVLDIFWPRQTS